MLSYCIQWSFFIPGTISRLKGCPHFMGQSFVNVDTQAVFSVLNTEVSSFQLVGIEEFHCIYRGVLISESWNRGVPLYTEVSSFHGVGIEEFHYIYRGVLTSES